MMAHMTTRCSCMIQLERARFQCSHHHYSASTVSDCLPCDQEDLKTCFPHLITWMLALGLLHPRAVFRLDYSAISRCSASASKDCVCRVIRPRS